MNKPNEREKKLIEYIAKIMFILLENELSGGEKDSETINKITIEASKATEWMKEEYKEFLPEEGAATDE